MLQEKTLKRSNPCTIEQRIIKQLSPRLQIGDFGCGEAKIMEAIGPQRVIANASFFLTLVNTGCISAICYKYRR